MCDRRAADGRPCERNDAWHWARACIRGNDTEGEASKVLGGGGGEESEDWTPTIEAVRALSRIWYSLSQATPVRSVVVNVHRRKVVRETKFRGCGLENISIKEGSGFCSNALLYRAKKVSHLGKRR